MPASKRFDDVSPSAQALAGLSEVVRQALPGGWQLNGEAVFSWSVFRLYRARLYTLGVFAPTAPYALDFAYLRNLPATQIVSTSVEEIQSLRAPGPQTLSRWAEALAAILPDVGLGDHLTGLFIPGEGVRFFSAVTELGEIADPDFAEAFGAIWLDPATRSPAVRAALLGLNADGTGNRVLA